MKSILIADDDSTLVEILYTYLQEIAQVDYQLDKACNRSEVLEKVKNKAFDLILLDIWLGGDNGVDICKELKTDGKCAKTKIVFFTARSNMEKERDSAGADGIIYKPFDTDEFLATLKRYLYE